MSTYSTRHHATRLLRRAGVPHAHAALELIPGGSGNEMSLVTLADGSKLVIGRYLRPSPGAESLGRLKEDVVLRLLSGHHLPVPQIVASEQGSDTDPESVPAALLTWLPGSPLTACLALLPAFGHPAAGSANAFIAPADAESTWISVGETLRAIHRVPLPADQNGFLGAASASWGERVVALNEWTLPIVGKRLPHLHGELNHLIRLLPAIADRLNAAPRCLVHYDFSPSNVLTDNGRCMGFA